jgi:hypothetical protein
MVEKKGYVKREKKAVRRTNIPRKHELVNPIEPMAIAILEAERHKSQLCRFNYHVEIDSKGRWVIDGKTIMDKDDTAGPYIRAARGLFRLGFTVMYIRNCPTLVNRDDEPVSLTLKDAEYIYRKFG